LKEELQLMEMERTVITKNYLMTLKRLMLLIFRRGKVAPAMSQVMLAVLLGQLNQMRMIVLLLGQAIGLQILL